MIPLHSTSIRLIMSHHFWVIWTGCHQSVWACVSLWARRTSSLCPCWFSHRPKYQTEEVRPSLLLFLWPCVCNALPLSLRTVQMLHAFRSGLETSNLGKYILLTTLIVLSPSFPVCVHSCSWQCSVCMCVCMRAWLWCPFLSLPLTLTPLFEPSVCWSACQVVQFFNGACGQINVACKE